MRLGKEGKKQRKKKRNIVLLFLGLSLLLHVFFVFILPLDWFTGVGEQNAEKPLTVDLDQDLLKKLAESQKQIVETEQSANKTPPKNAKYLGEHNQTVEQETRAHKVDSFRNGAPSSSGQNGHEKLALKNLAPKQKLAPPLPGEYGQNSEKAQPLAEGAPGENKPGQDAANDDYLHGVKEGDRTMLNTKEFVFFGYYHRIRDALDRNWRSKLRSTLENYVYSGRRLAGDRQYVTSILVVLDRHGKVTAVQILGASGARDLDQAAVDAFNQAGPFPDPPTGLVDQDGLIKIRWDFVLQS